MKRSGLLFLFGIFIGTSIVLGHGNEVEAPYIRVNGEGEVTVVPDQVLMQIGIQTDDKDLKKAKAENDEKTRNFLAMLKKYRVQDKDIQSNQIRMSPQYSWINQRRVFETYQVHRDFHVKIRNLETYDQIMSGAIDAGMDLASGIQFQSSRQKELESEARKKAVANALEKAKELISPLNQTVGKALSIEETGGVQPQYLRRADMKMADMSGAAPTIAAGESKIISQVSVKFELK